MYGGIVVNYMYMDHLGLVTSTCPCVVMSFLFNVHLGVTQIKTLPIVDKRKTHVPVYL